MEEIKNRLYKKIIKNSESDDTVPSTDYDSHEIFRRHFESNFEPLHFEQKVIKYADQICDNTSELPNPIQDESEWNGFSEDEAFIQVINYTETQSHARPMSKTEMKYFMSSKPPHYPFSESSNSSVAIGAEDASEAANLKNDLALQRLLSESHLLDSAQNPQLSGRNRHKATDLRIQALGSKYSLLEQSKMPMAHKKGIIAKKKQREMKRQKDARDNGIVLEKSVLGSKKPVSKIRHRGFGAPLVGRFNHGTLKLSKKDVFDIEGKSKNHLKKKSRAKGQPFKANRSKISS